MGSAEHFQTFAQALGASPETVAATILIFFGTGGCGRPWACGRVCARVCASPFFAFRRDSREVDQARVARWQKLAAEERFNSSTMAERKRGDKSLHKMIKSIQSQNKK